MRLGWRVGVVVAVLALVAVLGQAPAAIAQDASREDIPPEARQRFDLATTMYSQGRFVEAAEEFERVYALTSHADVLHNIYVAYRDAGDKRKAADALRRYLEAAEEISDRPVMEARLATLEREIAEEDARAEEEPEVSETPDPEPVEPVGPAPPPTTPASDGGPSLLPPALVLGGGLALVGVGIVLGLGAASDYEDLESDCGPALICSSDRQDDVDSLGTRALLADVAWISGAVIAGVGAAWLTVSLLGGSDAPATARMSPSCSGAFCGATVEGTF